ncbi:MAG: FKBP-type peptidyl-prolyl cis-trans isomerase [Myxococcota bacterium]|nr:FKBP-type peptidyl-prolyl cis-trans isomerase [Myxococcota bacterium]
MSDGTPEVVADGKYVAVHFDMKSSDGEMLESTIGQEPMGYVHGAGELALAGLEKALAGRQVGDKFELVLEPQDAYGLRDPAGYVDMPREAFPDDDMAVGYPFLAEDDDGEMIPVWITEIRDDTVQVTVNHPLAGAQLTFNMEVIEVRDATPEDLDSE